MYITKDKLDLIETAEKLIKQAIEDSKQSFELGNYLQNCYLENALLKQDTNDDYLKKLCIDTNKMIYNFVDYVSNNHQNRIFKLNKVERMEGVPECTTKKLIKTISKIFELNIYRTLGVKANEL